MRMPVVARESLDTAPIVLAPAPIGFLVGEEEPCRPGDGPVPRVRAGGAQTRDAEPGPVGEADAPETFPTAVGPLPAPQKPFALPDRALGLPCEKVGKTRHVR